MTRRVIIAHWLAAPQVACFFGLTLTLALALAARAEAAGPVPYGGRLGVPLEGRLFTLDPARARTPGERLVASLLHHPLFVRGPGGDVRPGLAVAATSAADDRRWRLVLHPAATDHLGRPVDARVVERSLLALVDQPDGWPLWGLEAAQVVDARVLELRFRTPHRELPRHLCGPALGIVAHDATGGVAFTGPFELARPAAGRRIELSPRRQHVAGRPFVDRLDLVLLTQNLMAAAHEAGEIDVAVSRGPDPDGVPPRAGRPTARLVHLRVSPREPPLRDPRVRRSLSLLFDRRALADVYTAPGGRPAERLIPPEGLPEGLSRLPEAWQPTIGAMTLRKALAGRRQSVRLLVRGDDPAQRALAERVRVDLDPTGLRVLIEPADDADFYARRDGGDFDLCLDEHIPDGTWLDGSLLALFARASSREAAVPHAAALLAARDDGGAAAALWSLEEAILDSGLVVPLVFSGAVVAQRDDVRGVQLDATGTLRITDAWLTSVRAAVVAPGAHAP